jgi:hypothetical protein
LLISSIALDSASADHSGENESSLRDTKRGGWNRFRQLFSLRMS